MNESGYQTLIVKFSKPITELDGIFDDAEAWGVETLKGWVEDYESSRFTAIDSHTAVITSEYNMECVKTWLETGEKETPEYAAEMAYRMVVSSVTAFYDTKEGREDN